jgi:hypothetical protein
VDGHTFEFTFAKTSAHEMDVIYKTADIYELDKKMCALESAEEGNDEDVKALRIYYVR